MKEDTMKAVAFAEDYFVAVIEALAGRNPESSRTRHLTDAVRGLEAISVIKYKQLVKQGVAAGGSPAVLKAAARDALK